MLRVLHVYKDYCPPIFGGIEKELALLCEELSTVLDVLVLVANRGGGSDVDVVNGVRVQKVGCRCRFLSAPVAPLSHTTWEGSGLTYITSTFRTRRP